MTRDWQAEMNLMSYLPRVKALDVLITSARAGYDEGKRE